jgi:hypothetical protein
MPEQQPIQPISENLWWVLPGKLAGVRKPSAEELNMLREAGVKVSSGRAGGFSIWEPLKAA